MSECNEEKYLNGLYALLEMAEDDGDDDQVEVLKWAIQKIESME